MLGQHLHGVAPLALLLILLGSGQAQSEIDLAELSRSAVFLEKSYLSPGSPFGRNFIMEGQTSRHFFLYNGLTRPALKTPSQKSKGPWLRDGGLQCTALTSMIMVIRIYSDFSAPVRTPSFIFRPFYGQLFYLDRDETTNKLYAFATGITHHSNGQAGCTFLGSVYDRDLNDCVINDSTLSAQRIANTLDGSFSTNFIPLDFGFRWAKIGAGESMDRQLSIQVKMQFEINQLMKVPESIGSMTQELAEQYGENLMGFYAEWEWRIDSPRSEGVGRIAVWYQARFRRYMEGSTRSAYVELAYTLKNYFKLDGTATPGEGLGLFARLHWGSDYYNIRFQDTDPFIQLGLMWDLGRLDKFRVRPQRQ